MRFLLSALMLLSTGCQAERKASAPPPAQPAAQTQTTAAQEIDIKISGHTYTPASVNVQKGKPVRLHFTRDEKPTCGDELVIPALNIKKKVELNQFTTIEITPQQSGELEFTCGMNMMKGKIVVQ